MQRRSIILFTAFVASLLAIGRAPAQEIVGLDQVMRATEAQQRVDAEFETARASAEEEARQEGDRLQRDEAMLDSAQTTVADLRQLRSEIDGRKIRLEAVDARIGYANTQMLGVEGSIHVLSRTTPAEPTTLEELVQIVKLRRLRDLRKEMANSIEQLNRTRIAVVSRLAFLEERTALAQAHSQITSFDAAKELARDPRTTALQGIVTRLVEESVRLGNRAASLTSSELRARRNLLEIQADRTFLHSNLRAGDIELLEIEVNLEFLRTILAEPAVPHRLLEEARAVLASLSERTTHRLSAIAEVRRQLADQDALLPVSSSDLAAQIDDLSSIGDEVRTLAKDQEAEIRRLETGIAGLHQEFVDEERTAQSQALFLRHSLPASAEAWEHTRSGILRLPARIGEEFRHAGEQIAETVGNSTPLRLVAGGLVAAALGLAALWARTTLRRAFIQPEHAGALVQVAGATRDNLLMLMPALAWYVAGKVLRVPDAPLLLVFSVLAIWPAAARCCERAKRSASAVLWPAAMDANFWRYRRRLCRHHVYAATRPDRRRSHRTDRDAMPAADRPARSAPAATDPHRVGRNPRTAPIAYPACRGIELHGARGAGLCRATRPRWIFESRVVDDSASRLAFSGRRRLVSVVWASA
jgi:hypothetical protein